MAYCFTCGAWAEISHAAMCRPCVDAWHPARTGLDPGMTPVISGGGHG